VILVDTTPLVALCDGRDALHARAVRDLASLAPVNRFAVCDAVLTETCFHLPHPHQRQRLRLLLRDLGIRAIPLESERDVWFEILDWLARYAEHEPDWADGCLAVLSGHDAEVKVWTYDREFRTTWRRPDGGAIPLATRPVRSRMANG
jgi:predicted nucleic acid-binding protein